MNYWVIKKMKQLLKSLFFNIRFTLSASNNFLFVGYYKHFYKAKKGSMNEMLSQYSKSIGEKFTVVQIGANDGITHDPIHKFIKRDNWSGVLLEPQKLVFDQFLKRIYRKHQNITTLNAAMGERDGEASIYKIGFSDSRWATGLTTFDRPTLEKAFTSGHVQRKCEKEGSQVPDDKSQHIAEEKVEVISSDTIVAKYNLSKIDLLMIDTEGFDFEIIKLFKIEKHRPGLIIFEHSHLSEQDYTNCLDHLEDNSYSHKKDGANTVAILNDLNKYPDYFKG